MAGYPCPTPIGVTIFEHLSSEVQLNACPESIANTRGCRRTDDRRADTQREILRQFPSSLIIVIHHPIQPAFTDTIQHKTTRQVVEVFRVTRLSYFAFSYSMMCILNYALCFIGRCFCEYSVDYFGCKDTNYFPYGKKKIPNSRKMRTFAARKTIALCR